ncbi:HET domain-containing protein [Colletotrichum cuscutae]|uniref:HET domain-containing protein n=1 Tax=Colletotrichum cuscutae TaxID=1209917 RepID=A0AAI9UKI9_9PEZI|nr:HET domain-containing protein [Colletotrichum cuscutae]
MWGGQFTYWSFFGTRKALESEGVEKLSKFTVRETTRVEDMAYCLLGIFDVNMPLLYGEGDRAFRRLQEEILRTIEGYSLMAWTSYDTSPQPLRIYSSALASHPRDFGTMRIDTSHVSEAAIKRDFDRSTCSSLIKPDKELMLRPDFSPPALSPRGISITMFTNRVLNPHPNTWLAWTDLNIHLPNGIYCLCIMLSDEDKYTNCAAKAYRRDTDRLYAVPFAMLEMFQSTTFYLRATPAYYVESLAERNEAIRNRGSLEEHLLSCMERIQGQNLNLQSKELALVIPMGKIIALLM